MWSTAMIRTLFASLLLTWFGANLVGTASASPVERRAIPPSFDAFYTPPAGFASKAPGTILRSRQVVTAFFGFVPQPVKAYQLLYRTTAIDGSAIATVTTIFKPPNAALDKFVSFQTAYDSSATICNPSYNYQFGAVQVDLISAAEQLIIQLYLAAGYIVASSDYEGPDAAFSAARLSGTGVLDGIRAVTNFKDTLKFSTNNPPVVGVGYSGGAIATAWAAALQPTYAPEIAVKGWSSGGTPANLTGTFLFLDNSLFSGFLPAAVAGLNKPSAYRARLNPLLEQILTAEGRSVVDFATKNCAPADILRFPSQSVLTTDFQSLGPALPFNPTLASILQENTLGVNRQETPTVPVQLYHASQDEIIPYANASTLFRSWCANGATVKFTTYAAGGHLTTEILGVPEQVKFVQAAFAGSSSLPKQCSLSTVLDNALDPLALGVNLEPILVKLAELLLNAGDRDVNVRRNIRVYTG